MFNQSRRKFVKGVAYSSALTMGGISGVALAGNNNPSINSTNQEFAKERITLINHTASSVSFCSISLSDSSDIYQYLAIKDNKLESHADQRVVTIAAGEQLSFVVATHKSNDSVNSVNLNNKNLFITDVLEHHLAIKSEHRQFNGIFPITTTFKAQAA